MRTSLCRLAGGLAWVLASASCGTGPPGTACPDETSVVSLLRIDCTGRVVPGRARALVDQSTVFLELPGGLDGRALVDGWPPRDAPPWLGHGPVTVRVEGTDRVRLDFPGDDEPPLLLLADRRLAPRDEPGVPATGDARDLVDTGRAVLETYDERTIGYARSLDRPVERRGFDRRYYVILAEPVDGALGSEIFRRIGVEWAGGGPGGTRRTPRPEAAELAVPCAPVISASRPPGPTGAFPTVAYPARDPAARELAERIVSASLPGRATGIGLEGLRVRSAAGDRPDPAASDVAVVLPVPVGSVHPCSVQGDLQDMAKRLGNGSVEELGRVFPVGESARFRIGPEGSP